MPRRSNGKFGGVSEETKSYEKGDRAAIVTGRDAGVRGEVFWVGQNKYGPGLRYGLKADDGRTHWVDEASIGSEEQAPPAPEPKGGPPPLEKGAQVKIIGGRSGVGTVGEVFWVGSSRYGAGMRYGVRGDDEQTHWVDEEQVEALDDAGASPGPAPANAADAPGRRGASRPARATNNKSTDTSPTRESAGGDDGAFDAFGRDDELPPEAFEMDAAPAHVDDGAPPPEAYGDDALPPEAFADDAGDDDDMPF